MWRPVFEDADLFPFTEVRTDVRVADAVDPADSAPVSSTATTALLESLNIRRPEVGAGFVAAVMEQLGVRDS